jgi:hypothetical protein
MADSTPQSDAIMREARRSLSVQQGGGYHRRMPSIGRGSADLKQRNLMRRIKLIAGSLLAIVLAAMVAGLVLDGIGFTGIMVAFLAVVAATFLFSNFPKVKVPRRDDLNRGDVRQMVARTELWLEHQRPALPPPAITLVDQIGVQLDALGLQLEHVDPLHPAAVETRKLVGETLPGMIDDYRKIPQQLRTQPHAGATPEESLVGGLGKISAEIDRVTRQLADGALDNLAVRTRYLEYRYGAADEPGALPDPGALPEPGQWPQPSKVER